MFFLTTVCSKVGIVTKHFTSGHFVYNELGRVSIHTASKEITDSFPYSDLSGFGFGLSKTCFGQDGAQN